MRITPSKSLKIYILLNLDDLYIGLINSMVNLPISYTDSSQ